jgi:uncharacterized protein (DUF169 family)
MSPFKHPKVTYGFPTDPYDNKVVNEYTEDLSIALGLKRQPVGVKLIFDEESYSKISVPEIRGKISYCCMVEKATRGIGSKSILKHHNCDGGTTALGLEESTDRIESGEEYFSYNLYATPAAARRTREGVPGLYRTGVKTYGLLIQPLNAFNLYPDIVILMVNPYQAMRIQQGYIYHGGGRINTSGAAMQAICAEATVEPYLCGRMNSTTLCPSTRFLAKWKDEEMAIGLPFEHFVSMVEGVMATINTTDLLQRKKEIAARFAVRGKTMKLDLGQKQ